LTGNCDTGSAIHLGTVDGSYTSLDGNVQYFAYYTHALAADRVHAHYAAGFNTMVSDTFTRANDSSHLGSADTGQAWTAQLGTWGIASNTAYCSDGYSTGNGGSATVDGGAGVREVQVEISTKPQNSCYIGLVMRYSDSNNYWFAFIFTSSVGGHDPFVYAGKCVSGTFSYTIASAVNIVGLSAPYTLRLAVNPYNIWDVFVNDVLQGQGAIDSFNSTATLVGLMESGTANSLDNFQAIGSGAGANTVTMSATTSLSATANLKVFGTVTMAATTSVVAFIGNIVTMTAVTAVACSATVYGSGSPTVSLGMAPGFITLGRSS